MIRNESILMIVLENENIQAHKEQHFVISLLFEQKSSDTATVSIPKIGSSVYPGLTKRKSLQNSWTPMLEFRSLLTVS